MKINDKKIPTTAIKAIGSFLLTGSMTYDEIIKWAGKFHPSLKLDYNDIATIEEMLKEKKGGDYERNG